MSYSIIIPARYASSRLPGKPLIDIAGKPMIQHVYERAKLSQAEEVIVATDDDRIINVVQNFGGIALLTSETHKSGTDRLQEIAKLKNYDSNHIVVNIQGDEPLLPVSAIEQVVTNIQKDNRFGIATLCEKIESANANDILDPNAVKVVFDNTGKALYFSRAPIPFPRDFSTHLHNDQISTLIDDTGEQWFRHIGIYAYKVGVLHQFVSWQTAPLERIEMLEQLRAIYHGVNIHCEQAIEAIPAGIDTEQDLNRVRQYFLDANHV